MKRLYGFIIITAVSSFNTVLAVNNSVCPPAALIQATPLTKAVKCGLPIRTSWCLYSPEFTYRDTVWVVQFVLDDITLTEKQALRKGQNKLNQEHLAKNPFVIGTLETRLSCQYGENFMIAAVSPPYYFL